METKAISIAKLTPVGITVLLATSILSLPINTNHAKGFEFMTAPIISMLISDYEKEGKSKK